MPTHLPAFLVTVALLAMVPGANNATITRQVIERGRLAGWLTVAGTSTGIVVWSAAAAAGISSALLADPAAYSLVRAGGAAVLSGLGLLSLRRSWTARIRPAGTAVAQHPCGQVGSNPDGRRRGVRLAGGYGLGVMSSLGNPKAGVIAVSLLPQFVTGPGPLAVSMLALGLMWAVVSGSWFCGFVWLVDRARNRLSAPRNAVGIQAVTGLGMLCLGVATALM